MANAILELVLRAKNEAGPAFASAGLGLNHLGKAAGGAEKDIAGLAGKGGGSGFGALGGMLTSFAGGPVTVAIAGLTGLAGVGLAAMDTYGKFEVQTKSLDEATKAHGITLADEQRLIEGQQATYENLGFALDQVRPAFTLLTQAGLTTAQQQAAMVPIMDLARAKNLDLATAASLYTKGIMGNSRALLEYGIKLPPASNATMEHAKALRVVSADTKALDAAEQNLTAVEHSLAGKTHLTTAEQHKLAAAHAKAEAASKTLHGATYALSKVQSQGAYNAKRLTDMNTALLTPLKGQTGAITDLQPEFAKLSNMWETFATQIGPGVQTIVKTLLDALVTMVTVLGKIIGKVQEAIGALANSPLGKVGGGLGDLWAHTGGGLINTASNAIGGAVGTHAAGGWVGLRGPELSVVGERGPEYITPSGGSPAAGRGSGGITVNVNGANDPAAVAREVMLAIKRELTVQGTSFSSGY
ncbi:MAG: hypothetical protein ACYDB6_02905 [Candidatus Limnocylindrales bacterium]